MLDIPFINEVISEHTVDTLREALKDGDLTPGTRQVIEMALHHLEAKEN